MFLVASYDIVSDQRRAKVANTLKDYGSRVQYSVFECDLEDRGLTEMMGRVTNLIDVREDSFRIYLLCEGCVKRVRTFGKRGIYKEPDIFIV
jgi:CRISPR-associated protein Cas2